MIGQTHLLDVYFFNCAGPPMKGQHTENQRTLLLVITSYLMHALAQKFQILEFRKAWELYVARAGRSLRTSARPARTRTGWT